MVSPVNRLNYMFHYEAVVEMDGFPEYNSRRDFVTGIHDDSRSESLDRYAERTPQSNILDSADVAIVYELEFEGQPTEVRLEYDAENEVIGVDMEDNGKRSEFVRQISQALDGEVKVKTGKLAPHV